MFGKRKTSLLLPTNERFDTLIGKTSEIYGRMVVGESLRIDGKVVGNKVGRPILSSCDDGKVVGNKVGRPTLTCDIGSSIDCVLIRLM